MSQASPAANWVFTINNYTDAHEDILKSLDSHYLLYGKELAPTTGTPHLQGYIQLKKKKRRTALVKLIACFWEVAKGDVPSQDIYCKKDKDFYEAGTPINVLGAAKKGVNSLEQRIARNKRLRDTDLNELVESGEINISHRPH